MIRSPRAGAPRSRSPRALPPVLAGVLLLTTAGCSGGGAEKEADVPHTVCGVPMRQDVVSPLLPDGSEVRERGEALPSRSDVCYVGVDRTSAFSLRFSPVREAVDPMDERQTPNLSDRKPIADLPFRGKGATGAAGAAVSAECGGSGPAPHLVVDLALAEGAEVDSGPGEGEPRAALRAFAVEYLAGARKKLGCG